MIFYKPGYKNTLDVFKSVEEAAEKQNIDTVIIASSSGETGLAALEFFGFLNDEVNSDKEHGGRTSNNLQENIGGRTRKNSPQKNIKNLIVVSHVAGFEGPDVLDMEPGVRKQLEAAGAVVVTAAHSLGGVGRAARIKFGTYGTDELMAHALRLFGEGTKVAIEVSMMAADAGAVSTQERVIAIGGTSSGADTALILQPANTHRFFDVRVDEILCKPAVSKAWFKEQRASEEGKAGQ